MAQLTDEQLAFLDRHDVPLDRVFDATGMSPDEYKPLMSGGREWVAYGVSPCRAEGHTLRTRGGHCVQCSPMKLSFVRRADDDGEVYVAASWGSGLVKIGTAKDPVQRVTALRTYAYGGATDWELHEQIECARAGKIETMAHRLLEHHRARDHYYVKDKSVITCRELFRCSAAEAVNALRAAAGLSNR